MTQRHLYHQGAYPNMGDDSGRLHPCMAPSWKRPFSKQLFLLTLPRDSGSFLSFLGPLKYASLPPTSWRGCLNSEELAIEHPF